ncbi:MULTISPECIES: 3-deoxy-7-phosphoheptulonate synthase [Caldilinea]|jgi:3-deoxy-7-phosphoheptulonate synthase|uniref:Phospho-2-dehydro-3-deoxyheptonate aldolase n=2 Tax=Caldilinea aerophila TaxID=133453 RepID=I0I4M7_CALAS|nr:MULTISPECIES: 3-deoxy-7-phosphoheptulonate synthase [Caldilinea]MBO9392460.1 3-deoxy-7-phosphoheptulonate synthase [Caldilinea sp.]BAM00215.1 phospho-2-dehydro-3-deoxyheptonate aldolase [Caldilinea aerophila DSM 14535 = NBRC 104270]GIV71572.1 MAG: 3-deoxy-7-phosphoheptulonate synthase [Caldilinea sp.]
MIIVMKAHAEPEHIEAVVQRVEELGYKVHLSRGEARTIIGVIGADEHLLQSSTFEVMEGVERTMRVMQPFKLASRDFCETDTVIDVNGVQIGGKKIVVMAGPCSVESREMILETAHAVKEAGATVLRGGAFKPRSSPYTFQGLGEEGLKYLAEAREQTGLPVITEVMTPEDIELVGDYTDIFQVGARNTQNYALLKALGKQNKPVFLKRGISGTIQELLMSAEYILAGGNMKVMVCERGIRTYETATRNTFDINAIPVLKELSHLPVIADPAHGTGMWQYVIPIARAAVAAGADGIMVEVHPNPARAWSDGAQSLTFQRFAKLMEELRLVAQAVGREI